jgi:hypothetical protein
MIENFPNLGSSILLLLNESLRLDAQNVTYCQLTMLLGRE